MEKPHSLDVLMVGASELYTDYSPTLAWEEYGFTSYNLAVAGAPGNLFSCMIEEALRYQSPKAVVINISGFYWGDDAFSDTATMHKWFDSVPWSADKAKEICSVVPKNMQSEFFFRILKYHNNWKHPLVVAQTSALKGCMDWTGFSYTKGLWTFSICGGTAGLSQTMPTQFSKTAETHLRDLITFCRNRGLENVLFVAFPHQSSMSDPSVIAQIESITDEAGYDFLNLDKGYESLGIDDALDFSDPQHLNVRGLRKMTNYLGNYLTKYYGISGEYSQSEQAYWDKCAEKTKTILTECENELDAGVTRSYYEASVYRRSKALN